MIAVCVIKRSGRFNAFFVGVDDIAQVDFQLGSKQLTAMIHFNSRIWILAICLSSRPAFAIEQVRQLVEQAKFRILVEQVFFSDLGLQGYMAEIGGADAVGNQSARGRFPERAS